MQKDGAIIHRLPSLISIVIRLMRKSGIAIRTQIGRKHCLRIWLCHTNTSVNVSGGTKFVRYFAAADFVSEGDLFKTYDNHRGYNSGFGYNRINVRSNLDFNLTKTTKFSTNLFGSNAQRTVPWDYNDQDASYWAAAYKSAPDAMRPVYSNGMWGWYQPRKADCP